MDLGIAGRVALVTGASKGIGLAVASALAAEGARVAMAARGAEALEAAAGELRRGGAEVLAFPADVSVAKDTDALLAEVRRRLGDPEIAVLNAGGPPPGLPSELDDEQWASGFQLTLMSAVRLARGVLPAMRRRRWGRIINITSLTVREPVPNLTLSNALRAGVTGFARTLATEVAADGVTVNNVAPGYTATERLGELFESEAALRKLTERIPARRLGAPEEIAAVAAFLASQKAGYITGQTVTPDGGFTGGLL